MNVQNQVYLEIPSCSSNESFVRSVGAAFVAQLDPTIEEVEDVKTAISEVVTNAVIHAYEGREQALQDLITLRFLLYEDSVEIECTDFGKGIEDIEKARQPLYTSKPHMERSGMGFTIMENFMDNIQVFSEIGKGTTVKMLKCFKRVQKSSQSDGYDTKRQENN